MSPSSAQTHRISVSRATTASAARACAGGAPRAIRAPATSATARRKSIHALNQWAWPELRLLLVLVRVQRLRRHLAAARSPQPDLDVVAGVVDESHESEAV